MTENSLEIQRIDTSQQNIRLELAKLRERLSPRGNIVSEAGRKKTIEVFGEPLSPQDVVTRICEDVRTNGMESLLAYCKSLDGADLDADSLRVSQVELSEAHANADPEFLATVSRIRDNIMEFQAAIVHTDRSVSRESGVTLTQRYVPMRRAGLCVPGGAAAYPSTVLMTAVPAMAAGVDEVVVVAPPTQFGANNPDLLATCHEIGIKEVYRIGGAQAVATLAYGVQGIEPVDIIVGPGNMFVALAKQYVFGEVAIDSIAGPSEVVVIADETTRADYTAADLLAQAEHAPGASILVTWSKDVLQKTYEELNRQVVKLSRESLTRQSLESFGALILVQDKDEAIQITNEIGPEHLHIATDNARDILVHITNAGATFLGNYSPVAIGDYVAGPSHVLPTGGTARFASGLSSNSFLRSTSVIEYGPEALAEVAQTVGELSEREGLTAHRHSVDVRVSR